MSLVQEILSAVDSVPGHIEVRPVDLTTARQNQLLFFFKPECFESSVGHKEELLNLMFRTLEQFNVEVSGCIVVDGPTLETLNIMDRHYGYINTMSRGASALLAPSDRKEFILRTGASDSATFLGGHEILEADPSFTPETLNELWTTKRSVKIRGGLYGQVFDMSGAEVVIVNGFHPAQLEHFTGRAQVLTIMVMNSDLPWLILRRNMIGETFPDRALPGSIRRELLDNAGRLGLRDVSISNNYCHLSAGPFEANFELDNFLKPLGLQGYDSNETRLARLLDSYGKRDRLTALMSNPLLDVPARELDLFSATEDCDLTSAAQFALAFAPAVGSGDVRS